MNKILLIPVVSLFFQSCATVNNGDWSELMRREDLARQYDAEFLSNQNTSTITFLDILNIINFL